MADIAHVVVLMLENRSFNSTLGRPSGCLPGKNPTNGMASPCRFGRVPR
jgi:phospholipase C